MFSLLHLIRHDYRCVRAGSLAAVRMYLCASAKGVLRENRLRLWRVRAVLVASGWAGAPFRRVL